MATDFISKIKIYKDRYITVIGILTVVLLIFFPLMKVTIKNKVYILNGSQILNSIGIQIKNINISKTAVFPLLIKTSLLLQFALAVFGNIFFVLKKYIVSAFLFFVGAMTIFLYLFSLNSLKNSIIDLKISSNKIFLNMLLPYKIVVFLFFISAIASMLKKGKEKLAESIFFCSTILSIMVVCSVVIYMLIYGMPAILKIGLTKFLFGTNWEPQLNKYGIFYLIVASVFATVGAAFIAIPFGVLCAIYLSEMAPKKLSTFINPVVEILAGFPSVIYGLFGMTMIVPAIKNIFKDINTFSGTPIIGDSLLAVIFVLAMMIMPTIVSTSYLALKSTPKSFREASLNLGASKTQTIFKITLKSAKSGIFSGITLAISKAIGETMAVIMVAGNVVKPPEPLGPVRLLTTGIAIDMAYSCGILRQALFGIGLVLLLLIVAIDISFKSIIKNKKNSNN